MLGRLSLVVEGEAVALPKSRKARAILAYCVLTGRPQRREHLCELFFDLPDDPRAALRWHLSKLRPLVNRNDAAPLQADREQIWLDLALVEVDLAAARARLASAVLALSELRALADSLEPTLLEGLDLPRHPGFEAWLAAERLAALRLRLEALRRLALDERLGPEEAAERAALWAAASPFDEAAAGLLATRLRRLGRAAEAEAAEARARRARGEAGLPTVGAEAPAADARTEARTAPRPQVRFCCAADGVRIAWTRSGAGPPLVKAANWLNHVYEDWASPLWGPTLQALAERRSLIRYDGRGSGLSDRDIPPMTFEGLAADFEATVAAAAPPGRFALLGHSQGCAIAIDYAARHPDRVGALVLIGGFVHGWRHRDWGEVSAKLAALAELARHGWAKDDPAYRRVFAQAFLPHATVEEHAWHDRFLRQATTPANAAALLEAVADLDVTESAAAIRAPTLILHSEGDENVPLRHGRTLAALMPQARFLTLESANHVVVRREPAWTAMMEAILAFLEEAEAG